MGKGRILIVDDDELIRRSLHSLLQGVGYSVELAARGGEALKKTDEEAFNVVLIDIRLPDMTGTELLGKIKPRVPHTRKVILTGYPDINTAIEAVNKSADGYLVKPLEPSELIDFINKQIELQSSELKMTQEKVVEYIKNRVEQIEQKEAKKK